ncbi:hypothetical protein C0989_005186 [Termitomyces sp. Mn162]|nr:hypothetical protein C0989_005186 [Termitomyces sp. Mn162]
MASDGLERLINQCKSNDGLLNVLKACLRIPNQHLTTATLAALPPLLPLLLSRPAGSFQASSTQPRSPSSSTSSVNPSGVDVATLRQVLNTFLPAGGVIDRLGDKEKAQLKARETLVIMGGLAFRTGSGSAMPSKSKDKGLETPLAMFERFLREGGLASPGVTDGARADLKKEMTKKGVRKTIVEGVLSKVLGASVNSNTYGHEGSENGDAPDTKPKEWIHSMVTKDSTSLPSLCLMTIRMFLSQLVSLRTTVSANTSLLYSELAAALGSSIDPFCEILLTNLLKMAGLTKKITAQQSQASVTAIIAYTSAQPRVVLPLLWNTLQEKTVQARTFVVGHVKQYVGVHGHRSKHVIESTNGLELLEKSLKKALNDANPAVRENARVLFWVFEDVWPEQGLTILESLDLNARKQVEKLCPKSERLTSLPPTTPKPKKSLAATIAASRAKAKAIATAPPTLRHQATSGSHVPPVQRPASPATSPKSSIIRPSSPLRVSVSPPALTTPGRPRTISGTMSRSVNGTGVPSSHSRSPSSGSNGSGVAASPPSPSNFRRRASSPLATSTTSTNRPITVRKALQSSPPSSSHVPPDAHNANGAGRTPAVPIPARRSRLSLQMGEDDDESLLKARIVPIPDSDSDEDHSINLISFSTPFEVYPPMTPQTRTVNNHSASPRSVVSKPTVVSNALSSGSVADMVADHPVVEDALRARAEQAESAAERLLELVDAEEESLQHSTLPPSLLVGGNNGHAAPKTKTKDKPMSVTLVQSRTMPPATPINRNAAILKQAAMFQDSPIRSGQPPSSLVDVLQGKKHETGWWLKRKACKLVFCETGNYFHVSKVVSQGTPLRATQSTDKVKELQNYITELVDGELGVHGLQKLALFSIENPVSDANSPLNPGQGVLNSPSPFFKSASVRSLHADIWEVDKNFERLFNALIQFLESPNPAEELEYGLILLWELIENQGQYIEGRESDLFSVLLRVLEATSTIRDALTASIEPVYGITTMHASLRAFLAESRPAMSDDDVISASYAFGLIALGKFILRLPAEIAEEELPRLRGTLISSLNDKSSLIVRESAAAVIIAAQLVLRDETHLFVLLDGLADEKKNLLTYLFDKHGARGLTTAISSSGMDKLQKEINRLDTRTSTPFKPVPATFS